MTHDERMRQVANWLTNFLSRFKPPQGLGADAIKAEMLTITNAVNGTIPNDFAADQVTAFLDGVGERLALEAKTRSWPLPKDFKDACLAALKEKISAKRLSGAPQIEGPSTYHKEELAAARAIKEGRAVSMSYVYGPLAEKMKRAGLYSEADLQTYKKAYWHDLKKIYGEEIARRKIDEMTGGSEAAA